MIFPIKTILETWITYDSPFCMMVDVGPCFQPGPKHIGVHRHIHILQCAPAKGALRIERESKPYPDDWVYLYGKNIKDIEVHMGIS